MEDGALFELVVPETTPRSNLNLHFEEKALLAYSGAGCTAEVFGLRNESRIKVDLQRRMNFDSWCFIDSYLDVEYAEFGLYWLYRIVSTRKWWEKDVWEYERHYPAGIATNESKLMITEKYMKSRIIRE